MIYLKKYYFARQRHVRIWEQTSFRLKQGGIYEELLIFFAKNLSFLEFQFNYKEVKTKSKFFGQSWTKNFQIFRFCVLGQFLFTISETELDYYHQKVKVQVASQVADQDLRLRILGNEVISRKSNAWIRMQVLNGQPKSQILMFFCKIRKKSAVKHSTGKPVLLDFVNLSMTFCPRWYPETQPR